MSYDQTLCMMSFKPVVKGSFVKPEIITGQYNSRARISNVTKSRTRLYFLVGVASEARVEKIAKNIEFLNMKRNLVLKYNIFLCFLVEDVPAN